MIVVGVDPGARNTGIAVIDYTVLRPGVPKLIASTTISRPDDGYRIEAVPRAYLQVVLGSVLEAVVDHGAAGIGCEGIHSPTGHAKGRGGHIINPGPLLATAQVVGAIIGRMWRVPCYRIEPLGNGHLFPLHVYPDPIGTRGKGNDKRQHERSAFDVALSAAPLIVRERNTGRTEEARA